MSDQATDLTKVTDDDLELQVKDLTGKEDKTPEDTTQLETLKTEKSSRYQKRIDQLTGKSKYAEEQLEVERTRAEQLEKELEETKKARSIEPIKPIQETVVYEGKAHYTDDALNSMIVSKQITENQAYVMQRERDKAEITESVRTDLSKTSKQSEDARLRQEDVARVLKEYPQFDRKHSDFDPNNELYKEANEIYNDGYAMKPDGMSKAIKKAKRILGITDKTPDLSDELSITGSSKFGNPNDKPKEIVFNEQEKDDAIRVWTNVTNPATGRNYTDAEAIEKAKKAKQRRAK